MTPCREWTGTTVRGGYGRRWLAGRMQLVHRAAWEAVHGAIPDGLHVLHHCDNPPCYNVDHLFLGTALDNARDRVAKGRSRYAYGPANARSKITYEQRDEIRRSAGQVPYRVLAERYGLSVARIGQIVNLV